MSTDWIHPSDHSSSLSHVRERSRSRSKSRSRLRSSSNSIVHSGLSSNSGLPSTQPSSLSNTRERTKSRSRLRNINHGPRSRSRSRSASWSSDSRSLLKARGWQEAHENSDAIDGLNGKASDVLSKLIQGNKIYQMSERYALERKRTSKAQHPTVIVVSCSDSRVDSAIIFNDNSLGSIFQVRTAGHIIQGGDVESIRFAILNLKPSLLVVLGHTMCGAVSSTYDAVVDPHHNASTLTQFASIVSEIAPAVNTVLGRLPNQRPPFPQERDHLINECVHENAVVRAKQIHILCGRHISVVPIIYDTASGIISVCCQLPCDPPPSVSDPVTYDASMSHPSTWPILQ